MSELRLYNFMPYFIELPCWEPCGQNLDQCISAYTISLQVGEAKLLRTVLLHKDQWTRDSAECC